MLWCCGFCLGLLALHTAWAQETTPPAAGFVDARQIQPLAALLPALADAQVILVGETHTEYGDHRNQHQVLTALHQHYGSRLTVGLEWFQQPYQGVLDQFIAGQLDLAQLLDQSEYFTRWRYELRLYQPILDYLQAEHIPTLALNLPSEITGKVGKGGLDALTPVERATLPELDTSDLAYRTRLEAVFKQHPRTKQTHFANFHQVQLLWDEAMAERAAVYLRAHPEKILLIFAGNGHLEYGAGIPNRLRRRLPEIVLRVVLNGGENLLPGSADFVLLHDSPTLSPTPNLGAWLERQPDGLHIHGFAPQSVARTAGLHVGDVLLTLEEQPLANLAQLKWLLAQQAPGATLRLKILRKGWGLQQRTFNLTFPAAVQVE
jgi:uncharacterized iron-regulated protein